MPKEFYNQPLIEDPNLPEDEERIGFGQPGQTGSRNIKWSYFKQVLQSVLGAFNWIDLSPQDPAPTEQEGRFYYDDITKAFSFYTDIAGTPPSRAGRTLRSRCVNGTTSPINKGDVCKIVGLNGVFPEIAPARANSLEDVRKTIGMAMTDMDYGGTDDEGYVAVFDTLVGVNTAGMAVNDLIYLSPTLSGGFTNVEPDPPAYALPIGFVAVVDAVNGVLGLRFGGYGGNATSSNTQGIINGLATQTPNVSFSVSGGVIYADLTNEDEPAENFPFLLGGDLYFMNVTTNTGPGGAARVIVPPGASATATQASILYLYLNAGTPEFAAATSAPVVPHVKIADVVVFDDVRTLADGKPLAYRRQNNAIDSLAEGQPGGFGMMRYVTDAIRFKLGSNWLSGQDATPTVNDTTIRVALSAGEGAQLHRAGLPSFDGLSYLIYNDTSNNVTFQASTNLTDIAATAAGVSLLSNNTHYTIRLYYQLNSNGIGNNVIATRPLGKYTTLVEAILDPLNYTIDLNDPSIEETVYPLYDLVISRTGSGGTTITLGQLTDLRSKLASGSGGGGASGGGGTDDKVRISAADITNDYLNPKISVAGLKKEIVNPGANEQIKITGVYRPPSYPSISTGVLDLDCNNAVMCIFETSSVIAENFRLDTSNAADVENIIFISEYTGTVVITQGVSDGWEFPSVLPSFASWDSGLGQLTLTMGTAQKVEINLLSYQQNASYLVMVSEVIS